MLAFDHDVVERGDELHHERDLGAIVGERHVLAKTRAQVLGLAHVYDGAIGVFPQVTPGIGGHLRHLIHKTRGMPGALLAHMLACRPHGEGRYGHMHAGVRYLQL